MGPAIATANMPAPTKITVRLDAEELKLFQSIKQRVLMNFQALLLKVLEASGIFDCYESFDLSLQVRGRKINGFAISERPPLLSQE